LNDFSDYIVYVDESGDHSLTSIDPDFPVFALSFCVVRKDEYTASVVPAVQDFKFKYWGHDAIVLHEHEIRKSKDDFAFLLTDSALRAAFYADMNTLMRNAPFSIIASVIDKLQCKERDAELLNPYDIALQFCMERLHAFLTQKGQAGKHVHVVFEKRGKTEDADLRRTFLRILSNTTPMSRRVTDFSTMQFTAHFAAKSVNSTGLQLADLTARPIALKYFRPQQINRAYDIIASKNNRIEHYP